MNLLSPPGEGLGLHLDRLFGELPLHQNMGGPGRTPPVIGAAPDFFGVALSRVYSLTKATAYQG